MKEADNIGPKAAGSMTHRNGPILGEIIPGNSIASGLILSAGVFDSIRHVFNRLDILFWDNSSHSLKNP